MLRKVILLLILSTLVIGCGGGGGGANAPINTQKVEGAKPGETPNMRPGGK